MGNSFSNVWDCRALLDKSHLPFFIGSVSGKIVYSNKAWQELIYSKQAQEAEDSWIGRFLANKEKIQHKINKSIDTKLILSKEKTLWVKLVLQELTEEQAEGLFACFIFDCSNYYEQIQKSRIDALHDPLTGLPNRALFLDRLDLAMKRPKRGANQGFCLFYLDLDDFKEVNDNMGHQAGDELLSEVGRRLSEMSRKQDTVCRWGGDEFIILVEGLREEKQARLMADRILNGFSEPFIVKGEDIQVTASIGIAINSDNEETADSLLQRADKAMYYSKTWGKNTNSIIASSNLSSQDVLKLEKEIDKGMQKEEFFLEYQPIMNLSEKSIAGLEALIRWNRPGYGIVYPGDFIPVAEKTGLIFGLQSWVIKMACRQMAELHARIPETKHLKLHINISDEQLKSPEFLVTIKKDLSRHGLDPRRISLECLRSSFFEKEKANFFNNKNKIMENTGINLVIDDLQINLKNLSFFFDYEEIPFNMVKLESRIGINYISTNSSIFSYLKTFVKIFSQVGVKLAVKGIETEQQVQMLKLAGCRYGQGNLLSRPLSRSGVEEFFLGSGA